jgi:hypothetical protein
MWLLVAVVGASVTACTSDGASRAASPPRVEVGAARDGQVDVTVSSRADASVPLGVAFVSTVEMHNRGNRSVTVPFGLTLTSPSGQAVTFYSSSLFVPAGKAASEDVAVTPAQWYADRGRFDIAVATDGAPSGASLAFDVTEPTALVPVFEDATVTAGLTTSLPTAGCGQFSSGAAWGDVESDGDLDLLVTRLGDPVQLFVNDGSGHFGDEASARGLAVTDANGAAFADYDNDGDADLVLVRDASDLLLANDGAGRFTDVSSAAGIGDPGYRGMSASWSDFDADGHLDLYVTNYMSCTGDWNTEEEVIANVAYYPDTLYRNNGDGTFTDVTTELEHDPSTYDDGTTVGAGFAAAWLDYNGDNRPDLYLANDFVGPSPDHNRLWRNDGSRPGGGWLFTDVSTDSGTAFFMNTMGIGVGDIDRDGHLDMALSNITANKLLHNDGQGHFAEALDAGVGRPLQRDGVESITWGGGFHDFNLDGWDDLYLAAGNFFRGAGATDTPQPNELYVNDGSGRRFLDVSAATGAADSGDSKGVAFADFDRDGDVDMYVVNQGGQPRLYENVTARASNHWLEVDAVGTVSNRDGCGAQLTFAPAEGPPITRQVSCGSTSVSSGSDRTVHVGLGTASMVPRVEVVWPSGVRQGLTDVPADRVLRIEEPSS